MKTFTKTLFIIGAFLPCFGSFAQTTNGSPAQSLSINLYRVNTNNSVVLADGALEQYNNSYSAGIDFLDAVKLSNINETLGVMRDSVLLSIERRPVIGITDTVFINLTKTTKINYQFQLVAAALNHPGLNGTLMDSYTNTNTSLNLTGTTTVNFSVDANAGSQVANRFMIVFGPNSVTPVHFTGITAFQQKNDVVVDWSVENEMNTKEYHIERSTDGNTFTQLASIKPTGNNGSSQQYTWIDASAVSGNYFYRVSSIGSDGALLYSEIAKVKISGMMSSVSVYPNPVSGGIIALQLNNMKAGIYTIRLSDSYGKEMSRMDINHAGGSATKNIPFNSNMAKGIYQMEVIGPDKNRTIISLLYQ